MSEYNLPSINSYINNLKVLFSSKEFKKLNKEMDKLRNKHSLINVVYVQGGPLDKDSPVKLQVTTSNLINIQNYIELGSAEYIRRDKTICITKTYSIKH